MSGTNDEKRLRHMLEAAQKAQRYGQGTTRDDLAENELLCLALVRLLEIIGEAASRVSETCRQQHAEIPWRKIVGMRNRLIHGYDQIDLDVLWQTLNQDLQPLIDQLQSALDENDDDSN